MRKSFNLAGAFVGVIVGAGFGSGQEVMQFFTNYGIYSVPAVLIAMVLFAFIGMQIAQLGSHLQSVSHKQIIQRICGRYIGTAVDFILSFFLFGVAVIMIAGAGSIVEQQFGIPAIIGSLLMTVLTVATLLLNVRKIISIISSITPFLLAVMIVIAGYTIFSAETSLTEISAYSNAEEAVSSNWLLSSFLYVSFNIAVGFPMLAVMGGIMKNKKEAGRGGIIGGILLGILLLLINVAMMLDLKNIQGVEMPTLYIANEISPVFGHLLSIILLAMVYNTCVGMFYAFAVRFVPAETKKYKVFVSAIGVVGFLLSFVGFTTLVGTVYPIMGYIGFIILGAVTLSWFRALHHKPELTPKQMEFGKVEEVL
ncbi:MAG: hypothetical protein ACI35P_14970 [Bacillus sp. (in: firmicutes)]